MKRIGDILTRNKTPIVVEDDVSYKQVTIRTNYKGVVLRGKQNGATILTKNQFSVSAGQFILSRIDARNGAFGIIPDELEGAIVTNDFLAFDINEDQVEREFFNIFLQSPIFLEACVKASRGNTNRKRVEEDFFLNYEINLPPISDQHDLIKKIKRSRESIEAAQNEIVYQKSLISKLKQAIIQEAIQGDLTTDWRTTHPDSETANALLKRIQAGKTGSLKIRQGKALSKNREEMPFEIPNSWVWCSPIDVCQSIVDCPHSTPKFVSQGKYCIDSTCIDFEGRILHDKVRKVTDRTFIERNHRLVPEAGDIIFVREGLIGQAIIVPRGLEVCLGQRVMLYRPEKEINGTWLRYVVTSKFFLDEVLERHKGMGAKHINMSDLRSMPIPCPPLAEQEAIVERVESMIIACRTLEAEVEKSQKSAENLFKAVLREAFSPIAKPVREFIGTQLQKEVPVLVKMPSVNSKGRVAFACYVLNALKGDQYLGRTKMVKIEHLAEYHCGLDLGLQPIRDQHGPVDIRSRLDAEKLAGNQNWYSTKSKEGGKVDYLPGPEMFKALELAEEFMGEKRVKVDELLELLRPLTTLECEIVATLYASWNDFLLGGKNPLDEEIVDDVWNWHPDKRNIPKRDWKTWLWWLRKKKLIPQGKGKLVPPRTS